MVGSSIKVKDFLKMKSRPVIVIGPNETVAAAMLKLVENKIGALPVSDNKGVILGIVSERDLLKVCSQRSREIQGIKVAEVMTRDVAIGILEDDLDYVMNIMTQKNIRHLPIMVGSKLEGMVSIRDIVEVKLAQSRAEVRFLSDYISGGYV